MCDLHAGEQPDMECEACMAEVDDAVAQHAWMANQPAPLSREEWESVYADNPGKRDSYDRLVQR